MLYHQDVARLRRVLGTGRRRLLEQSLSALANFMQPLSQMATTLAVNIG